jgi:hypothetical protein
MDSLISRRALNTAVSVEALGPMRSVPGVAVVKARAFGSARENVVYEKHPRRLLVVRDQIAQKPSRIQLALEIVDRNGTGLGIRFWQR